MLTERRIRALGQGAIFATGVAYVDGKKMRWAASRGNVPDWAVYMGDSKYPASKIIDEGKKCYDMNIVQNLVPCDDSALSVYRR